ncbi:hypothetical protein ACWDYJ_29685 [Streptomyces sp. NPDC003042]
MDRVPFGGVEGVQHPEHSVDQRAEGLPAEAGAEQARRGRLVRAGRVEQADQSPHVGGVRAVARGELRLAQTESDGYRPQ